MKIQNWWGVFLKPKPLVRGVLDRQAGYLRSSHVPKFVSSQSIFYNNSVALGGKGGVGVLSRSAVFHGQRMTLGRGYQSASVCKRGIGHFSKERIINSKDKKDFCSIIVPKSRTIHHSVREKSRHIFVHTINQNASRAVGSVMVQAMRKKTDYRHAFVPFGSIVQKQKDIFESGGDRSKNDLADHVVNRARRGMEAVGHFGEKSFACRDGALAQVESRIWGATQRLALRRHSGGVDEISSPQYPGLSAGYL